MDQQLIDYLKAGQSYYPTNTKARAALDDFRASPQARHFDFVLNKLAVLPKSTNQMQIPTFGRFVSIDSEIIRGSNAIVYIPLPLPHHQNSDRWREAQLIMERHRVES